MNKDIKQVLWKYSSFINVEMGELPHLLYQSEYKILRVTDSRYRIAEIWQWKGQKPRKRNSNGKKIPIVEFDWF